MMGGSAHSINQHATNGGRRTVRSDEHTDRASIRMSFIPGALMISRVWHGWTARENADAYEKLLLSTVLPGIERREIQGYHGAFLYRRDAGDEVEFVTTMLFDSMDGVRAFAGPEYTHGVVPPAARALLARFDETSAHYDVRLVPSGTIVR
jgi:hypothetical protein